MLFKKSNNENESTSDNSTELIEENKLLKDEIDQLKYKISLLEQRIFILTANNETLESQKNTLEKNAKKLSILQKDKDDLFSMVLHDIKNPASAIENFVQLLNNYDLNANEQHEIMSGLINTSKRILALAEEVSKVVSSSNSFDDLQLEKSDISNVCDSVKERYTILAQKKKIAFSCDAEKISPFRFDAFKIEQAIDNLVSNAIKFAPNEASVEIIINKDENKACVVQIKDTGFGLNEAEVKNAFLKGSKLSTKPTGGESSTGLGLWIVKRIIDEHHGRVWVKSKRGTGSTFAFRIPMDL